MNMKIFNSMNSKISDVKMINVRLDEIEVGERFRQDMGDIEALASSISKNGLIQPIAVYNNPDPGRPYKLIVGGRRYKAIEFIKTREQVDSISCRLYEQKLSELDLRILEFAENLYRKSLSWQEDCDLKEHILSLQQKIHGVKTSTAQNAPGFSMTDMAKMTGYSKSSLSDDISLSKIMKDIPEVNWGQFKTKDDARKALKAAKQKVVQASDAKIARASLGTGDTLKKRIIDSYHVEDFFEGVQRIGDNTIDFIELDPPYAIDIEIQKKGYNYTGYNEIKPEDYPNFMQKVLRECFRVLKTNCWIVNWFGPDPWMNPVHHWLVETGFKNKRMPALWVKGQESDNHVIEVTSGQTMQPERDLAKAFEFFYYARKGIPLLARPGASNVFGYRPVPPNQKIHPTERPIELMKDILTTFVQPNSKILIPFAGSGNTLIAAAMSNMLPIGFDLTQEYYEGFIVNVYKTL